MGDEGSLKYRGGGALPLLPGAPGHGDSPCCPGRGRASSSGAMRPLRPTASVGVCPFGVRGLPSTARGRVGAKQAGEEGAGLKHGAESVRWVWGTGRSPRLCQRGWDGSPSREELH